MAEYEMPIEEQVKSIAKELRGLSEAMREAFETVDKSFGAVEKRFDAVDQKFDAVDQRFDAVDKKIDGVDRRFDAVDKRLDKLQMLGEETKAIAKLGLEGIESFRESTDAKFAETAKINAAQTELLTSLSVHLRKRVEVVERKAIARPKTRRRS